MLQKDKDIQYVIASTGGGGFGSRNTANFFIRLKDEGQRTQTAMQIANRISMKTRNMAGASLFLMPAQDLRVGGRSANATYQYSLQSDNLQTLREWSPKAYATLKQLPELTQCR